MTRIVRALGALLPIVFAASCRDDSSARSSIAGASARVALAAATLSGQDAPLANERRPRQRVCREEPLIHCPKEQMAEAFKIAVHRGVGNLFLRMAVGAVLAREPFRDAPDSHLAEIRQEQLQAVKMPRLRCPFG